MAIFISIAYAMPLPQTNSTSENTIWVFQGWEPVLDSHTFLQVIVWQLICSTSTCKHVWLISQGLATRDSPFEHLALQQCWGEGAERWTVG